MSVRKKGVCASFIGLGSSISAQDAKFKIAPLSARIEEGEVSRIFEREGRKFIGLKKLATKKGKEIDQISISNEN